MVIRQSIFVLIGIFCVAVIVAEEGSIVTVWQNALLFGIDQQVITTIQELKDSRTVDLAPDVLLRLEESQSALLYEVGFQYFREIAFTDAVDFGIKLIQDATPMNTTALRAILLYLSDYADSIEPIDDELIEKLGQGDVASYVAITLGKKATPQIIEKLIEVYEDQDTTKNTRLVILSSLADAEHQDSIQFLQGVLEKDAGDRDIVQLALIALAASITDEESAPVFDAIEPFLRDDDAGTRRSAYAALTHIQHEKTLQYFKQGIRDDNWRVRLQTLEGIHAQGISELEPAVLFVMQHDPVPKIQQRALEVAITFDSENVLRVLSKLLAKPFSIRASIAIALLEEGDDIAVQDVTTYIVNLPPNSAELTHLATALPKIERPGLEKICRNFLDRNTYALQLSAIRTIARNGYTSLATLIEPFTSERVPVLLRHEASAALEILGE